MTEIKWKQEVSAITPKNQFHVCKINTLSCCRCIYRRVRALQSSLCDLEETDPAFRHIQGLSADISHKSDQDLQLRQILQSGIHRQIRASGTKTSKSCNKHYKPNFIVFKELCIKPKCRELPFIVINKWSKCFFDLHQILSK